MIDPCMPNPAARCTRCAGLRVAGIARCEGNRRPSRAYARLRMRDAKAAAISCLLTVIASVPCAQACAQATSAQSGEARAAKVEGIWKAAVPPIPMKGEFDSFDPLGIAAGARIKADCSLNWVNPDDGKLYCFSSGTSLEYFLDRPQVNIDRARRHWRAMTAKQR